MTNANEATDLKKLLIYEIKQLTRETEEKSDIYLGDNKLIEL